MMTPEHGARGSDAEEREAIAAWIEREIGARVVKIDRLRRWRAIWRVEAERDGAPQSYMVKGVRPWDSIPYSLAHEMKCMQALASNGVPIPHVYGMMDFPEAFVMDWSPSDGRDGALMQETIEQASTISPDRWSAMLKYMDELARIHKIPIEQFKTTEAIFPKSATEVGLANYELYLKMLEDDDAIDSMMQFLTLWLRRNVPQHRPKPAFVTGDCGQFLNLGPEISAIIDLEIGHIGDPMSDLACFRGRHPVENMGDVHALFRRYEAAAGAPLDIQALAYHTVLFLTMALIAPILAVRKRHVGGAWAEGAMQVAFIGRRAIEALAEVVGVSLDETMALPPPYLSPLAELAIDKLELDIGELPTSESFAPWQRGNLAALPHYLRQHARYGRWAEEEEFNDLAPILGVRPNNPIEAEAALNAFVAAAGPDQDTTLIRLFYRRLLRMCHVLAGPDAPKNHLLFVRVEPMLNVAW